MYGVNCTIECKRAQLEVVDRHGRTQIDSDVEGLGRRKRVGDCSLEIGSGDLRPVHADHDGSSLAGTRDAGSDLDSVLARFERCGAGRSVLLDDHHVVLVHELALLHVQRQPAVRPDSEGDSRHASCRSGRRWRPRS